MLQFVPLRRLARTTRSGCCTRRCAAPGSLIMRAADAHKLPAGGALAVDRARLLRAPSRRRRRAIRGSRSSARKSPACRRRNGTASSSPPGRSPRPRWPKRSARADRRRLARLLRRHRAHRRARLHRHGRGLAAVALRQEGSRRRRCRLHQLSAGRRCSTRPSSPRCCAGDNSRVPRVGEVDALFRRLPADRGDGGARRATRCASGR